MHTLNKMIHALPKRPEKILQFGTGNFLRAFLDWQIQQLNEKTDFNAAVICAERSLNPNIGSINQQDGLFHTVINGIDQSGQAISEIQLIDCISREIDMSVHFQELLDCAQLPELEWIFSNTTEAGIVYEGKDCFDQMPPSSFPAKLLRFLFERFRFFKGDFSKGLIIIPCELIDHNGQTLKAILLKIAANWDLSQDFIDWLDRANTFCSSLVDRIVPGFPHDKATEIFTEIQCQDHFLVMAEYFYLWVIEAPTVQYELIKRKLKQDSMQCPLNIVITDDLTPYKQQKVAILNGAHTALVPIAYLSGIDSVRESMLHPDINHFIQKTIFSEIIPTLSLPKASLEAFADDVIKRFHNPNIHHLLLSIALNSMSKFKARNLPQLIQYQKQTGSLPQHLCFALAALIVFYRGIRDLDSTPTTYRLEDDPFWIALYQEKWTQHNQHLISTDELVIHILNQSNHWGCDLNSLPELKNTLVLYINNILKKGMLNALIQFNQ